MDDSQTSGLAVWVWKTTKEKQIQSPCFGSVEMNLTSIREDTGWIPGLNQWVKDLALM